MHEGRGLDTPKRLYQFDISRTAEIVQETTPSLQLTPSLYSVTKLGTSVVTPKNDTHRHQLPIQHCDRPSSAVGTCQLSAVISVMLFTPCCAAPYLFSDRLPLHEQFLTSEPPMKLRTAQPTTTGTHGHRVYPRQGQAFCYARVLSLRLNVHM